MSNETEGVTMARQAKTACPFCRNVGGVCMHIDECADIHYGQWYVVCGKVTCEATGPLRSSRREAVRAWDARAVLNNPTR